MKTLLDFYEILSQIRLKGKKLLAESIEEDMLFFQFAYFQ